MLPALIIHTGKALKLSNNSLNIQKKIYRFLALFLRPGEDFYSKTMMSQSLDGIVPLDTRVF